MKQMNRVPTRCLVLLAVTVSVLTATSRLAPTTHAATQPHISVSLISTSEMLLSGSGFTPGGYVNVFVHNSAGRLILTASARASRQTCSPTMCNVGGFFSTYLRVANSAERDSEIARDLHTGAWSNEASA